MTAADLVGRVSGLAAVLGVGAVLGLAASATAQAAPADSSTPSSSPSSSRSGKSADAPPSPRRSTIGGGVARTANGGAAHSGAVTARATARSTPRPAATVTDRSGQPERPLPGAATSIVAAEPIPVAAPDPQVPPAPVAVVEAAAVHTTRREAQRRVSTTMAAVPVVGARAAESGPGPIARALMGLFNCDPRGRQITIYKGTHFAIPNNFGGFFVQRVAGTGTLTSDSVYDLKDEDQKDWSKFTGIAFTPLEPDRDSAMVGWRYNLTTEEFEIAPFYNVDKVRILPKDPAEVISVPTGETFDYLVDYTGITISYGDQSVVKPFPEGLTPNIWTAVRVSGWFGGNEVAPRTLSYYIKFN